MVLAEATIKYARGVAGTFGERAPVLLDAVLTTAADTQARTLPTSPSSPPEGPQGQAEVVSDDAQVLTVRMWGRCVPLRH